METPDPSFLESTLPPTAPPTLTEREPIWGYVDVLLVIGLFFAGVLLVATPLAVLMIRGAPEGVIADGNAILQVAVYCVLFLVLKGLFKLKYRRPVLRTLGWCPTTFSLLLASVLGVLLSFAVTGVAALLRTPKVSLPLDQFDKSPGALAVILLTAVTAAPFFEELLFRGFLQPLFCKTLGPLAGIVLTGALFGTLHLAEYSWVWQVGVLITLVGIVFGYVRHRSGSLIPSTVMHACFNSISVIAFLASKHLNIQ